MRCQHCRKENPDDSRFCQYCGKEIKPHAKAPAPRPTYTVVETPKRPFCRGCGHEIDRETKRCSHCGKQYFRGVSPTAFLCLVLITALLVMTAACIVQGVLYHIRLEELEQLLTQH